MRCNGHGTQQLRPAMQLSFNTVGTASWRIICASSLAYQNTTTNLAYLLLISIGSETRNRTNEGSSAPALLASEAMGRERPCRSSEAGCCQKDAFGSRPIVALALPFYHDLHISHCCRRRL